MSNDMTDRSDHRRITFIDGVEILQSFEKTAQEKLFADIEKWFEEIKGSIPKNGIFIYSPYDDKDLFSKAQIELPEHVTNLIDAMLKDAIKNSENLDKPIAKILLERTGRKNSHEDDFGYHVDTKQVYWDENGDRVGYAPERGPDKYMAFISRPGSLLIEGKIDSSVPRSEAMRMASQYSVDPKTGQTLKEEGAPIPKVIQLKPGQIYKVEVGSILHAPPMHDDGLLITLSMIEAIPEDIKFLMDS